MASLGDSVVVIRDCAITSSIYGNPPDIDTINQCLYDVDELSEVLGKRLRQDFVKVSGRGPFHRLDYVDRRVRRL